MNPRDDRKASLFIDTIQQVQAAIKIAGSYPVDHPASRKIVGKSYKTLANLLKRHDTLTMCVFGDQLVVDNVPINGKKDLFRSFAKDLDQKAINSLTFHLGLSRRDFVIFLNAIIKNPQTLTQEGGMDSILRQQGVSTIQINGVKYGKMAKESKPLEGAYIRDYLSGRNDSFSDHGDSFLYSLENDPQRVSDLIAQVTESRNTTAGPSQVRVALETMSRITTDLVARQGVNRGKFNDTMTSILSACGDDILMQMSQAMEIMEGEKGKTIDCLVDEFLYDAISEICSNEYKEKGSFDVKFVKSLIPSGEERKKLLPHLKRKLKGRETIDEEKIIRDLSHEKPEIKEEKPIHYHPDVSSVDEGEKIKADITRLLSEGKSGDVSLFVRDLSKKLDDTSWKIRKKVAESLLEVTSVLDEFDKLKENFRDMSEALTKRVKEENRSDIYLIASENLQRVCTSQNRIDRYFTNETLGKRLFEANKLSENQLQKALMARKKNGYSLQYNLGVLNYVDEAMLNHFLAQHYRGCQTVILSEIHDIPENVLKTIPVKFVRDYLIFPFKLDSGNLYTATMNPNDLHLFNDIRFITGYSVIPHLAAEYYLLNAIGKFYHIETAPPESHRVMENIPREEDFELSEEKEKVIATEALKDSDAPVVKLVNLILKSAIDQKASDIHIEPYEDQLRVRLRTDGTLTTMLTPSIRYTNAVTSRIKIMSRMDISERRLPQDGRFKIGMNGNRVDFRVSTFPGIFGEKVVLRLLDSSNLVFDINNLGLNNDDLTTLLTAMYKSKGMILVTGPTGSGKTTTLYSMLHGLNDGSRNITTAEDPIEYNMKGINQFQMNSKIGLDFARALRTFLRQDPDIIMVGEIRDFETAEIAVKAALTGHLVLSTLHTNSALETITRLLDMGIEPYLLTSSLNLVVAQRLMRKICPSCKIGASPSDLQLRVLASHGLDVSGHKFFIGEGCAECNDTGYKGRVAVYEITPLWEEIQELILQGKSSVAIRQKAKDLGLVCLPEQGFKKVMEGITSLDEWMRAVA